LAPWAPWIHIPSVLRTLVISGLLLVWLSAGPDVEGATADPNFGCSINAIIEAGGASGDVSLGGCRVALKGVTLSFSQRERSKVYVLQNQPGAHVVGRARGSGTTRLSFSFPTPLLPGGQAAGGLLTHFFGVGFTPAVRAGDDIAVELVSTSGRTQRLQVTVRRIKCPAGVICSHS